MNMSISFMVDARPAGQGSKRALGPGRMVEQSKYVKPFRTAITVAAWIALGTSDWPELFDGPVNVELHFTMLEPKKHKYPYPPSPDVDKACRAALDALSGTVIKDDSQVVGLLATKSYGEQGVCVKVVAI